MALIAIISDSHDNLPALHAALGAIRASGATTLLHCGDLCAPFVLAEMAEGFGGKIHVVFGNNDADGRMMQVIANGHPHVTLHGIYGEVVVEGRKLALIHYPEPARPIAQSGAYALVAHGHNHQKRIENANGHWLVNPGELMGMMGAPTWALYDTDANVVELRQV